jgi:DNA-binding GntR family transcriptional regulator
VLREHAEIVRGIEEQSAEGAERSARSHLAAARHNFTAMLDPSA